MRQLLDVGRKREFRVAHPLFTRRGRVGFGGASSVGVPHAQHDQGKLPPPLVTRGLVLRLRVADDTHEIVSLAAEADSRDLRRDALGKHLVAIRNTGPQQSVGQVALEARVWGNHEEPLLAESRSRLPLDHNVVVAVAER